jgi:uncharacterized protein
MNLGGRTALVTGASGGLGQAIARALARRGADVVVTARRVEVIEPLAAELRGRAVPCDLADRDGPARLVEQAGAVDVLVANAGVPGSGIIDSFTVEEIDRAIDVNLRAPMTLARLMCEGMAERGGGQIVFVSSLNGKVGTARSSVYSATKFGLRGFAASLYDELERDGVGVTTVFPGFVSDAGMWADTGLELRKGVGMRSPEQVAAAVVKGIERNRIEIDVAPLTIRAGGWGAGISQKAIQRIQRAAGSERFAKGLAEAQRDKR